MTMTMTNTTKLCGAYKYKQSSFTIFIIFLSILVGQVVSFSDVISKNSVVTPNIRGKVEKNSENPNHLSPLPNSKSQSGGKGNSKKTNDKIDIRNSASTIGKKKEQKIDDNNDNISLYFQNNQNKEIAFDSLIEKEKNIVNKRGGKSALTFERMRFEDKKTPLSLESASENLNDKNNKNNNENKNDLGKDKFIEGFEKFSFAALGLGLGLVAIFNFTKKRHSPTASISSPLLDDKYDNDSSDSNDSIIEEFQKSQERYNRNLSKAQEIVGNFYTLSENEKNEFYTAANNHSNQFKPVILKELLTRRATSSHLLPSVFQSVSHHRRQKSRAQFVTALNAIPSDKEDMISNNDEIADSSEPILSGITADEFRHPSDSLFTETIRNLPFLEETFEMLAIPIVEQQLYIENVSRNILVTKRQVPSLYNILMEACDRLSIPLDQRPDLFIKQNPIPNAYTLAVSNESKRKRPFIVVHSALLDLLSEDEVRATIGHELGHLKANHGVYLNIAATITEVIASIPFLLPNIRIELQNSLLELSRSAEFTCDRAALIVARDPKVVSAVMMKLAGGSSKYSRELNVDEWVSQARKYDEVRESSRVASAIAQSQETGTHPLPVLRSREIERWANSEEYAQLCKKYNLL